MKKADRLAFSFISRIRIECLVRSVPRFRVKVWQCSCGNVPVFQAMFLRLDAFQKQTTAKKIFPEAEKNKYLMKFWAKFKPYEIIN